MFDQPDERQEKQPPENASQCLCFDHESSTFDRPELWVPVSIVMVASALVLLVVADLPWGIQIGSLVPYTAFVALGTFSAQRGLQPYFFECPIVDGTMPRLLGRHVGFVAAIVLLETIALHLTRYMPASWLTDNKGDGSLSAKSLWVVCLCIGCIEAFTNRTLLEQAHAENQEDL